MRNIAWLAMPLLLVIFITGSVSCSAEGTESVRVVQVKRGDLVSRVHGTGKVAVDREVNLAFGVMGRIKAIDIEQGDEVAEGQVLAQLETEQLEYNVARARTALEEARLSQAETRSDIAQAESAKLQAEYELEEARDRKITLELALLQARIDTEEAEYRLNKTGDIYTWTDIRSAKAEYEDAVDYLERAKRDLARSDPDSKVGAYMERAVIHAKQRVNEARDKLDAMLEGTDPQLIDVHKMQVDAGNMQVEQARNELELLSKVQEVKEKRLESARKSLETAQKQGTLNKQAITEAQKSLTFAEKQLADATLKAPFAGTVDRVYVNEGEMAGSSTLITRLIDPHAIEVIVRVDEIDIPGVSAGSKAAIYIDALPDVRLEGTVTTVSPSALEEAGIRVYEVEIRLSDRTTGLRPGMSATAEIAAGERQNVLLVPNAAIRRNEAGNPVVEVKTDDRVERREVVPGISDGSQTEILSGLEEGEKILVYPGQ